MNTTKVKTPYFVSPRFLINHHMRGTYYSVGRHASSLEAWPHGIQFFYDTENVPTSRQRRGGTWVAIGGASVLLLIVGSALSENQNTPSSDTTVDANNPQSSMVQETSNSISDATGVPESDVDGEFSIIDRYQLDNYAAGVVAKDAAELYVMEASDKYGAALQVAGVGSLNSTTDTLAHIVKAWNVSDTDVSHSLDVIFSGLTMSSISWNDYSNALIVNGPKMNPYMSLTDAAAELAGSQAVIDTQDALSIFNTMGNELAEPNSQLNLAMGGPGYVRTLVKQEGFPNATLTVLKFVQAHTTAQ